MYNTGVHLNLGGEIRTLLPILVTSNKTSPEQSGVSGKEGQCSYGETGANTASTTMTTSAHPTTSAAISPTVGHSGNTHCETADTPLRLLSSLPKHVSGEEIPSGKTDKYSSHRMPKAAFVREVDDDDINFELAFCGCVCKASKFSSGDNQTQKLVMGRNVFASPGEQGLSVAESPRKKPFDKQLYCHECDGLNVIWYEDVLNKPYVDFVGCLSVLGGYFYTNTFLCKIYLLLLAVCCHLKTNYLEDIHDHLRIMWTNGLSYNDLMAFAKDYKEWFLTCFSANFSLLISL